MKNIRCFAKISIKNLLHNFECIKALLPEGCEMIPIIKANAYSHGAIECARALEDKVSCFAVAEMDEALDLRERGIKNSILILGYTDPAFAALLSDNGLTQTVTNLEYAEALSARSGNMPLDIHIKIDTGMHRFGFNSEDGKTIEEIAHISKLEGLRIKGIFSHFAESDALSSDYTDVQLTRFNRIVSELNALGIRPETAHIANSAAILTREDAMLNAVRPGIVLYGAYPSREVKERYLSLHPDKPLCEVMTLCARVGQVMQVKKGESIGYSRTHTFERDSVIATVTAGYADGIPRALSNKGRVTVNGETFRIVGNVCMDLLMIDITDAKNEIKQGDTVTFWGNDGISADEYAELADTVNYTLYTGLSLRVQKLYER